MNLSLTAARSSRGKTLGGFQPALYDLQGNFVNIWDANGFFPFQGSFQFLPRVYIDS